jgi:homoserine acetyltransferase
MDLFSFPELERTLRATTPFTLGKGKALVIGVQEDQLFPIASQAEVAQKLAVEGIPTQFERLSSPYGHDAFLTERGLFEPILQSFLDT